MSGEMANVLMWELCELGFWGFGGVAVMVGCWWIGLHGPAPPGHSSWDGEGNGSRERGRLLRDGARRSVVAGV